MRDLNDIIEGNNKAGAADIPRQRANGKYVVATYAGVSYLAHSVFETREAAQAHASSLSREDTVGERAELLDPIAPSAGYTKSGDTFESLAQAKADRRASQAAAQPA